MNPVRSAAPRHLLLPCLPSVRPQSNRPWPGTRCCRDYDYAVQDGHLGVQIHHPRFLEWVEASESARLLSRAPSQWSVCYLPPRDGVGDAAIGGWSS